MTLRDKERDRQEKPSESQINPKIAEAVRERMSENEIPCAVAFTIAADITVSPAEVGNTIDLMGVHIIKCQLGLFGYKPAKGVIEAADAVSPELEGMIRGGLVNGKLPCLAAWGIAEGLELRKMEVSSACEAMKIKISTCQLGSF